MNYIKNKMPWLYQIIIAIAIAIWFDGINIISREIVKPSLLVGSAMCLLSVIIFLSDDGLLNELHNIEDKKNNNKRNKIAAIVSAANN